MKRFFLAILVVAFVYAGAPSLRADDKEVKAILDKALKALGGEDKLAKAKALSFEAKGTITIGNNDNEVSTKATVQGLVQRRAEFEGEFNGNRIKGVTVISNDKGWRKFGDMTTDLDAAALANEKRAIYLQIVPMTIVPLKGEGFKVESAGEENIGEKPAVTVKVTGPDGKDFKLSFDKQSGLPVKVVARVAGFQGQEFTQETTFSDYQDSDGIKRAGKVEASRDGQKFLTQKITSFKVLDKVDPKTFDQPE